MKILQLIPCLGRGGAERLVLNLANQLQKLGHEVLVVQLRPDNSYPELQEPLDVRLASSSVYYSVLGKSTIDTAKFDQLVDDFRPDVIHSHLLDSEFVSRFRIVEDTVYITHWHGCPSLTEPIPIAEWLKKESLWKWNAKRILRSQYIKSNTHFICISEFVARYIKDRLHVNGSELSVIHNAIDLQLFKPIDVPKKDGFRLINIGSLHRNKNHQFLFQVMLNLLKQGFEDVFLDIYGDGPERVQLQSQIEQLNLQKHIKLHGIVDDPEVQINQAHVMVHSAWHEPFGLIFIEAMACGIPVVSFNTGGPAELIKNGKNGFLVQKDDLNGFTNKVKQLYENRDELQVLGKKGIENAAKFGLNEYAKKVETLYEGRLAIVRK
ncbi:MAG: glycosyltransferase involved in cell wall biosynthesis [Bacteroidia bacterium]|jgi:glycosyltransferase involved in cell wall biosynthesis